MKMAVFWVVAPCSLLEVYRRFRGSKQQKWLSGGAGFYPAHIHPEDGNAMLPKLWIILNIGRGSSPKAEVRQYISGQVKYNINTIT
jgi:hypothetical protein